jgi:hypothetical protein
MRPELRLALLRLRLGLRSRHVLHAFIGIEPGFLAFTALKSALARTLAIPVHVFAGLLHLLAIRHDDARVVLGMLEIVFREDGVTR